MVTGRRTWVLAGLALVVVVVGFLLFRPDTHLTDIEADESLEDAFAGTTVPGTTVPPPQSPPTTQPETPTTTPSIVDVSSGGFYGIE
jgi:hypothetical protein